MGGSLEATSARRDGAERLRTELSLRAARKLGRETFHARRAALILRHESMDAKARIAENENRLTSHGEGLHDRVQSVF